MPALAQTPTLSDVRQAIVRHLIDNIGSPSISISEVSHTVRRMLPFCELTDWQLGDLIARSAIDASAELKGTGADGLKIEAFIGVQVEHEAVGLFDIRIRFLTSALEA
ncbi:hypothetical protein NKJ22_29010 [Mesorhizobium sp. M0220]